LGFDVEQETFTAYCRAGCEEFLTRDEALMATLRAMPYKKVVMTNTSETQGKRALESLELLDAGIFDEVYGGVFCAPACKPEREAFEKVLRHMGVEPDRVVMFEDSAKNLKTAKAMGMTTVFVETRGEETPADIETYSDAVVARLSDVEHLRAQLPGLFSSEDILS
jgi:putative hydrolase of the HAD superfamily